MTAFADITAAIVAALAGLAGGRVYRGQAWPMPTDVDSMVFVRPLRTTSERAGLLAGPIDWTTTWNVEIRVRTTPDSQAADLAVDALLGQAFAALAGVTATGVESVTPGTAIDWTYDDADVNVMAATISLDVIHRTSSAALTAWTQ